MLKILYVILIISSLISSFATISKGAWFSNGVLGAILNVINYIVIVVLIVLATINYSAIHILYMPILNLLIGWILTYFVYTFVYHIDKHGNPLNK